jgi:hypothetical protein
LETLFYVANRDANNQSTEADSCKKTMNYGAKTKAESGTNGFVLTLKLELIQLWLLLIIRLQRLNNGC